MLDKLRKMASQVQQQLKQEKMNINKKNTTDPTKPHFNHQENFKEYSSIVKDVFVKDPLKKAFSFMKKEKEIYFDQLNKTFPKETVQQYNQKFQKQLNSIKSFNFWNTSTSQNNNQKTSNYNSQQTYQKNQYSQGNQQNYQSNQHSQGYQQNYNQQKTQQNNSQNWFNWKSYFTNLKQDAQHINQKYQENIKEKKSTFTQFKEAKLNAFNYIFKNSVDTAKGVGKASFKYVLIGVFVFGFAYSIPKSISNFFATKAAISAQMQIENLKQDNEALRKENEFLKNNLKQLMNLNGPNQSSQTQNNNVNDWKK